MKIKSSIIRDTLELTDNHGEVVKTLPFTINVTKIAGEVQKKRIQLASTDPKDLEATGKTTVELFSLFFGEDNTKELLDFYENDYATMIADIVPYIVEYIIPSFDRVQENIIKAKKGLKRG